jgi:hypothetical protein
VLESSEEAGCVARESLLMPNVLIGAEFYSLKHFVERRNYDIINDLIYFKAGGVI